MILFGVNMQDLINKFIDIKNDNSIITYDIDHKFCINKNEFDVLFFRPQVLSEFNYNVGIKISNEDFEKFKEINFFKDNFQEEILNKYINYYILKLYHYGFISEFKKIEHDMHRLFDKNTLYYFLINREVENYVELKFKKPFNKKYYNTSNFRDLIFSSIYCASFLGINNCSDYTPLFNLQFDIVNEKFDLNIIANQNNEAHFENYKTMIDNKLLHQKHFIINKSMNEDLTFDKYLENIDNYDKIFEVDSY